MQKKSVDGRNPPLQTSLLVHQILGHTIEHDVALHTITIDGRLVNFSRTEYRLMRQILHSVEQYDAFVPFANLEQCFRQPPDNLRRLLYRRINSMRTKLWPFELDIVNVRDQGYALVRKAVQYALVRKAVQAEIDIA